jgi:hypothetical protein
MTSLLVISVALLAISVKPGLTAGEQDVREHGSSTTIRGVVVDEKRQPKSGILVLCSDFEDKKVILGETLSDKDGKFALPISPIAADKIQCWIGGDDIYETDEKIIPAGRDTQIVFILKFIRIPELEGWVQIPKDWDIQKVLVQVRESNGAIISERPDERGKVVFENIKAGPATVKYSYDGLGLGVVDRFLMAGSDISPTFRIASFPSARFASFPPTLILLIPAVSVYGLLACMSLWWRQDPDRQRRIGDPALMVATLVLWGVTFAVLWLLLKSREGSGLHFFHPTLAFSISVPIFGFIGAMVSVIDLFHTGGQGALDYRQFALRLVLGPYVAIVMVLLLGSTFQVIDLTNLGSQATAAFFSGFLFVLALQTIAEKGNEMLGLWRASSRYEPSEIARSFNLGYEEDIKLQKANMKYLVQLRILSEADLKRIAKQIEVGEGFLVGLRKRLLQNDITLAERLEKSVSSQIESLLSEPPLDNFHGIVCVGILNESGIELPSREEGLPELSPNQEFNLSVEFRPHSLEQSNGSLSQPISIRNGQDADLVLFEVSLDSETVTIRNNAGMSVTVDPNAPSPPLLFTLIAPEQPGRHEVWVEVFQKRKLILVVPVPISIIGVGPLL